MGVSCSLLAHRLRLWWACLFGLLVGCAAPGLPTDVGLFLERREVCDYVRGEFPDSPDARAVNELLKTIGDFCIGTDAELASLRMRYRHDAALTSRLAAFETTVERPSRAPRP